MKELKEGQFYGNSNFKSHINGVTVTDTEYTHEYVHWHYHENPYFTFLLAGKLKEENKKESYSLEQGSLVFHNWQDSHRNMKPDEYTRGAHIEINERWINRFDLSIDAIEGSLNIENPKAKNLLFHILLESKKADAFSETSVEMLVIELLSTIRKDLNNDRSKKPQWFSRIIELIHENIGEDLSLKTLSEQLGIHPVYLSRAFHKHQGISFGQYCREVRLHKTIASILSKKYSLTEVAYLNNYYDQSHMIADLKKHFKVSPKKIIKTIG